jgi:hypothetical protein
MKKFLVFEKVVSESVGGVTEQTYGRLLASYIAEEVSTKKIWFKAGVGEEEHFELPEGMVEELAIVKVIDGVASIVEDEVLKNKKRQVVANHNLDEIRKLREPLLKDADVSIFKLEDDGIETTSLRAYRKSLRECTDDLKEASGEAKLICETIVPSEFQFPTKPLV